MRRTSLVSMRSVSPVADGHELQEIHPEALRASSAPFQTPNPTIQPSRRTLNNQVEPSQPHQQIGTTGDPQQGRAGAAESSLLTPNVATTSTSMATSITNVAEKSAARSHASPWRRIQWFWSYGWVAEICSCILAVISVTA